ncbi:MAG: xanthine dehydrogenase [Ruminococcaceae bacterium]|nr:xanthine dehydrogenase [Oscillospiraceae bacterium]
MHPGGDEVQQEFQKLLEALARGECATLTREVEQVHYLRRFAPRERLILLGGGHVAHALARMAAMLDFDVTVADDRPEFANRERFPGATVVCDGFASAIQTVSVRGSDYVCVLTRGHRWDGECLRALLRGTEPRYLGMIGSKRRVRGLFGALAEEGFDPDALARIHAPIGLMIGAVTPEEIAVSICAQLIECRRASAVPEGEPQSGETVLEQTNADLNMLRFLAGEEKRKALCLVLETRGSTPVKSGAAMAVDALGRGYGTVGGGCGEAAVMARARTLLGTGKTAVMEVDMTDDAAAEDGLTCGGTMKVYLEDCT